jgi:glucuronoxylan 4-O-methyltransferase
MLLRRAHASDLAVVAWCKLVDRPIQLWVREILFVLAAIRARAACKLLVFGAGNDSAMWQRLNRAGRTAFVEDDPTWIRRLAARDRALEIHAVRYPTRMSRWRQLLDAPDQLELALPVAVTAESWDVILVDGPCGNPTPDVDPPGRMCSIVAARRLVAPHGDVFVHDCERDVEREYCARVFGSHHVGEVRGRALLRRYRCEAP